MQHIALQRMRIYIWEPTRLKTMYELPCLFSDILLGNIQKYLQLIVLQKQEWDIL